MGHQVHCFPGRSIKKKTVDAASQTAGKDFGFDFGPGFYGRVFISSCEQAIIYTYIYIRIFIYKYINICLAFTYIYI